MRKIIVHSKKFGNHIVLVNDDDYDFLHKHTWHLAKRPTTFYAYTKINCKDVAMHRLILDIVTSDMVVDHKDGNGLNNTRENIRVCTQGNNVKNSRKPITNTSGYKGVYRTNYNGFLAAIHLNNKKIHIGSFKTKELAALAYNEAALKLHGEFASLNQIPCAES